MSYYNFMASPALSNMNIMQTTNVILKFLVATLIKETGKFNIFYLTQCISKILSFDLLINILKN